jgi:hypothetical protein
VPSAGDTPAWNSTECLLTDHPHAGGENNLAAVRPYFRDTEAMPNLRKGEFMAFNRESRAVLNGKLF